MKLRPTLSFFFALLLAVTSQSMAVSRGMAAAAGQIVICTGNGTETIYVDASGAPTQAPHLCADCIVSLLDPDLRQQLILVHVPRVLHRSLSRDTTEHPFETFTSFFARAPPPRLLS